ncbi:MAG: methyltransferase family protein [bacterium]
MDSQLLLLILAWLGYFAIHSLLASLLVKQWVANHWPGFMPWYRLFFNLIAIVLLVIPLTLTFLDPGPWLWQWSGGLAWLMNGLALGAVAGFVYSLKFYDGSEFIGLRQLRANETRVEDQENLHISPLHRHVRHPWYFFAIVLLWTRDMTPEWLISTVFITGYFIVGSRLEDRKLIQYHGEPYRQLCHRVPGVFPLPGKSLSREEASRIERLAGDGDVTQP